MSRGSRQTSRLRVIRLLVDLVSCLTARSRLCLFVFKQFMWNSSDPVHKPTRTRRSVERLPHAGAPSNLRRKSLGTRRCLCRIEDR